MQIEVKGQIYECNKIAGKKYDMFCEAMDTIQKRQEQSREGYNKDDTRLMRETLAEIYDNRFTAEDLYDDMDTADMIYSFLEVQVYINEKLNGKLNKVAKNYQSVPAQHRNFKRKR